MARSSQYLLRSSYQHDTALEKCDPVHKCVNDLLSLSRLVQRQCSSAFVSRPSPLVQRSRVRVRPFHGRLADTARGDWGAGRSRVGRRHGRDDGLRQGGVRLVGSVSEQEWHYRAQEGIEWIMRWTSLF